VDQPSENTTLQILGAWFLPGTSDAMLVEDPNEAPAGGTFLGQVCYAADGSADGDTPLHRLYRADPGADGDDHMMSLLSTEGAPDYAFEGTLAHGWSAPPEGTDLLWRYLSKAPYDHDVGFVGNPPAGYTAEGPLAWVYPRNGLADETRVDVAGAEVAMALNTTAGGAVWSLTWGGLEFLSAYDFGRQLQIAFQMGGAGEADNPTEAGDAHATPYDPVGWRHGSPLLAHSVGPGTAWTRTRPLQWLPAGFLSAGQDTTRNPVAWDGTFEKDITLDHAGNPHIIAWTTQITFPEDHGALNIELATAYLTGAFDTLYTYDAAAGLLTDKSAGIPPMGCVCPQAAVHHRAQARDRPLHRREEGGIGQPRLDRRQRAARLGARPERPLSRREHVQHRPQPKLVRRRTSRVGGLLGRHIARGPRRPAGLARLQRDAQVRDLHRPGGVDQQVRRLQVAVDQPRRDAVHHQLVDVGEPRSRLHADIQDGPRRERPAPLHELEHGGPAHELQRHRPHPVRHRQTEGADHVGVLQQAPQPRLADQALLLVAVRLAGAEEQLQRDRLPKDRRPVQDRLPDLPRAANPEGTDQRVRADPITGSAGGLGVRHPSSSLRCAPPYQRSSHRPPGRSTRAQRIPLDDDPARVTGSAC